MVVCLTKFLRITISMNISIFMKGENSNSHILDKNNSCISCTQLLINVVLKSNYFSCSFLKLTTLELILEEKKSIFHQIVCLSMLNGIFYIKKIFIRINMNYVIIKIKCYMYTLILYNGNFYILIYYVSIIWYRLEF